MFAPARGARSRVQTWRWACSSYMATSARCALHPFPGAPRALSDPLDVAANRRGHPSTASRSVATSCSTGMSMVVQNHVVVESTGKLGNHEKSTGETLRRARSCSYLGACGARSASSPCRLHPSSRPASSRRVPKSPSPSNSPAFQPDASDLDVPDFDDSPALPFFARRQRIRCPVLALQAPSPCHMQPLHCRTLFVLVVLFMRPQGVKPRIFG